MSWEKLSTVLHPIQRYRIARGWTQSELARQVGVSVNTVQAWERGAGIRPRNLARLARSLGVEPLQLVNEIEEWRESSPGGRR